MNSHALRLFALLLVALLVGIVSPAEAVPERVTSLEDLLERADRYHPKVQRARVDRDLAAAYLKEKSGAFDPAIELGSEFLRYNSGGKAKEAFDNMVAVSFLTRSGLKVAAGMDLNRGAVKSPLSNTGSTGEVFFDLKLPLLRGSGINPKGAAETQARIKQGSAEMYYRLTRLQVLLDASLAWWDWVAARRRLEVNREVLDVAARRQDLVRQRVAAGDVPAIDAIEAEQEVARRREVLAKAERDVDKARLKLSLYTWGSDGQPAALEEGLEATPFPALRPLPADEAGVLQATALERRPELHSLKFERQVVQVDLDLARNERRARVDLVVNPGLDTGRGSVGLTMKAGLVVTIPMRTREADGRIEAAQLRLQRVDLDQASDIQAILVEVQDCISALGALLERHGAARQALDLARRLEAGERLRYELGDGTLFLVNQRERATAEASMRVIDIEAEHAQASFTLRAVSGVL